MLRIAARYADAWNGGYVAHPAELDQLRAALMEACAEVGRDPATLAITAELKVAYPDLAPPPAFFEDRYATGSSEEMASTLRAFDDAGFVHVMCHCSPNIPKAVERLGGAIDAYRATRPA
jgi:alkanesulfonate monooxygenase SsuD/methylene tetrahydromethanopterin reductase-like flavin-dependent oxidoreductase (luciferase family)